MLGAPTAMYICAFAFERPDTVLGNTPAFARLVGWRRI